MRIAALDLGSNSFHLLIADAHPDGTFEPLAWDKEMLRLGSVVARDGRIGEPASTNAVTVVARFAAQATSLEVDETVACATAALREAEDSGGLVDRIRRETGVRVRVISGQEEARLIFGAIRASVVIDPAPALGLDLGGGSLELMLGGPAGLDWATSLKLGVGRLTTELVRNDPVSAGDRRRLVRAVQSGITPCLDVIRSRPPRLLIGSSGTLLSLIRLAAARRNGAAPGTVNQLVVTAGEISDLARDLLAMTAGERSELPGVDSRRADLLPAGVVLLETVMESVGVDRVMGCQWALREGMVLDAIGHHTLSEWEGDPVGLRRESVVALCRRCGWHQAHAERVADLAVELFDGLAPLHQMGEEDRELLHLGALLHDIGEHVSVDGHDRHTAYLIRNGRLRGFRPDEIDILACLGRFHRRRDPTPSFSPFKSLSRDTRRRVRNLVAILRVADGLDRGHGGPVQSVTVAAIDPDTIDLRVEAEDDISLELFGLRRKKELLEEVTGRRLRVISGQMRLPIELR